MKIKTEFPHKIQTIKHIWIPMPDGCRLAARIWLPENAEQQPVPAILEYIPYRKNDGTALRDSLYHPYFAGHGYAAMRVDMRGSGDSEGVMLDEYLQQELDDAVSVIAWLVEQPWCDGSVGMMGKSWGGFNSLEVAALQPPALKAIITVCSSDDRYSDDVHYKGGCVLSTDMLGWSTTMLAWNARPPDPECWERVGGNAGSNAWSKHHCWCGNGSTISTVTLIGNTDLFVKIIQLYNVRCMRLAAGLTRTATQFRECFPDLPVHAKADWTLGARVSATSFTWSTNRFCTGMFALVGLLAQGY